MNVTQPTTRPAGASLGTRVWAPVWARWRALPPLVQDGGVGVLFTLAAFVPGLRSGGVLLANLPPRPWDALALLLVAGQGLPLVLRRRAPALSLALVGASFAVYQARGYTSLFTGFGLLIALYSVGVHQDRGRARLAAAGTAAYVVLAVALHSLGAPTGPADHLAFFLSLVACWGAGAWVRARSAQETRRRSSDREAAVFAERARIARELHDVVTHHVTAMVVQADAAAYLTSRPERLTAALGDISATGRKALVELRHQLGVLDPDSGTGPEQERAPAVGRLQDLVEGAVAAGQPVRLVEDGRPGALSAGVELAVYRVVQESLTNALKHAPSQPVTVALRYADTAVDVEVTTAAGSPVAAGVPVPAGSGRGLTGLRERVGALDGQLQAGPGADGGFRVHAHIPAPAHA